MDKMAVISTNISSVEWGEEKLTVNFKNGTSYVFDGVPKSVFDGFGSAKSAGKYFNQTIKGTYEHKKI